MYDAAVSRINNRPNANDVKIAITTLKWLWFVKENIQETALQHAIAVRNDSTDIQEADVESIRTVLSLCLGLVVMDQERGTIRLVHETTQEHFRKYFGKEDGNSEIASVCLRYFSFSCFSRAFDNDELFKNQFERYPLSRYAVGYWAQHVREASEDKFCPTILSTFELQGTRDSTFLLRRARKYPYPYLDMLRGRNPPNLQILHLAALYNLPILAERILRPHGNVQKLYAHNTENSDCQIISRKTVQST